MELAVNVFVYLMQCMHSIGRDIKSLRPKSLDLSSDRCPASVDKETLLWRAYRKS